MFYRRPWHQHVPIQQFPNGSAAMDQMCDLRPFDCNSRAALYITNHPQSQSQSGRVATADKSLLCASHHIGWSIFRTTFFIILLLLLLLFSRHNNFIDDNVFKHHRMKPCREREAFVLSGGWWLYNRQKVLSSIRPSIQPPPTKLPYNYVFNTIHN